MIKKFLVMSAVLFSLGLSQTVFAAEGPVGDVFPGYSAQGPVGDVFPGLSEEGPVGSVFTG